MTETYTKPTHRSFIDRTGAEYTRARVLEYRGQVGHSVHQWLVLCDPKLGGCGKEWIVRGGNLASGKIKSCGCLRNERRIKHGKYGTRAYQAWLGMIQRCYTPTTKAFKNYGGRGITVCDEWRHNAAAFLTWAGEHPLPGETIDRIDSNGHYSESNCRWADRTVQNNNTSRNRRVTSNGKTQTLTQWAHELGVHPNRFFSRLRRGWTIEELLSPEIWAHKRHHNAKSKLLTLNGKTQTQRQWAIELHIPQTTISNRLKRGWSVEKALQTT